MKPGSVAVGFLDPGEWSASFGLSLVDLYLADAHGSRRIIPDGKQLRNYCGTGGLVDGRNEVAAQFLDNTDNEWLFMVDSDMGFAPDTVDRLVAAADERHRPVLGGLCFALRRRAQRPLYATEYVTVPTIYEYVETGDGDLGFRTIMDYPSNEVVPVAGTGAACLLVHRRALEAVREKYGPKWFNPVTLGPKTFSEDLSFCVRLAGSEIPVHVHTGVKTSHYKGGVYLDEQQFRSQPALAEA